MRPIIERISAITLKVDSMEASVLFYRDILGMELVHGGTHSPFSSLRTADEKVPILNLELGRSADRWGRMIFHVSEVDMFWAYLKEKGFNPQTPQDATWGERYFHMQDPDGHELSFARPL
jgi:catechol 2,3-dioxygenase-like lactoylglutathione lyase family enzyme